MIFVVMGVAGAGKSTVGRMLAEALGAGFLDADELHPPANIEKMSRGVPLTDADRAPWLGELGRVIDGWLRSGGENVLACSALKASYRDALRRDPARVVFIYLKVDEAVLRGRLAKRAGHFAGPALLQSQLEALEEPRGEGVIEVDASEPPEVTVERVRQAALRTR